MKRIFFIMTVMLMVCGCSEAVGNTEQPESVGTVGDSTSVKPNKIASVGVFDIAHDRV